MLDRKQYIADIIESFSAVYQAMLKMAPAILDEFGITYTQMFILKYIKRNEGVSLKKLAGTMGITSSAATQQVNILVKKGYLLRKESDIDRRLIELHLAEHIDKRIEEVQAKLLDQLCSFFNVISDEELELYYMIHRNIVEHVLKR